jgi:hypothetical protein
VDSQDELKHFSPASALSFAYAGAWAPFLCAKLGSGLAAHDIYKIAEATHQQINIFRGPNWEFCATAPPLYALFCMCLAYGILCYKRGDTALKKSSEIFNENLRLAIKLPDYLKPYLPKDQKLTQEYVSGLLEDIDKGVSACSRKHKIPLTESNLKWLRITVAKEALSMASSTELAITRINSDIAVDAVARKTDVFKELLTNVSLIQKDEARKLLKG